MRVATVCYLSRLGFFPCHVNDGSHSWIVCRFNFTGRARAVSIAVKNIRQVVLVEVTLTV
jgi:hypothetical protein